MVNPIRAVLEAHLAAAWNRSRQELGKAGSLAFAWVMGFALLVAGVPTVLGSALFGYALLGRQIDQPELFAPFLGGALALLGFFGGIVGGITGGSRVLAWESYRVFPLRLRHLFAAELAAGLAEPLCLGMALMAGCLLLGVGLARPAIFPFLPLPWLGLVAVMLCLQHLVGSLAARAVKRLQVALVLLVLAAAMGSSLVSMAVPHGHVHGRAAELRVQRVKAFGTRLGQGLRHFPTAQAALGLHEAGQGRWLAALGRQLPLAGAALLLLLATARLLRREASQDLLRAPVVRRPERLWGFSSPRAGLSRLHWQNLVGSHLGKFSLLVPLMTLALLKGPLSTLKGVQLWALPASFGYLALTGIQFQMNQFGLDGPGVKALLLLPVRPRTILEGKFWALAAFQGLQAAVLLVLLGLAGLLDLAGAAAGLCLAGCLFLAQTAFGQWTSAWLPRPMPRDSLKNSHQAPLVVWLGMAVGSAAMTFFGGLHLLAAWLAPGLLLPLMAALFAGSAFVYGRLVLPHTSRYLERRREALVAALG